MHSRKIDMDLQEFRTILGKPWLRAEASTF